MTHLTAKLIGWALIALCLAGAVAMDAARLQYQNFNALIAICLIAAAVLVLVLRRLADASERNEPKK